MTSAHAQIIGIFEQFCDHSGLAYRHDDGDLSYRALYHAARNLAERLIASGSHDPVLIWGHKDRRMLIGYWAALLSGRPVVPVEPGLPRERLSRIAALCGADVVLLAEEADEDVLPGDIATLAIPLEACGLGPRRLTPVAPADGDTAYILFSSGTTGEPKGIAVTYANLADFIVWMRQLSDDFGPIGGVTGNVRFCFDVSLFEMWLAWINGSAITALDHRDVWNTAKYIARYGTNGITTWVSTPALAAHWLKDHRFCADSLPGLREMVFCGEVLPKSVVRALWDRFPDLRILNTYGPTECTVAVSSIEITPAHLAAQAELPIGAPRPGTAMHLAPAEDGGEEIVVTGQSVGAGYLGAPDKQARAFPAPATYRTGDRGRLGEDGLWYFGGRRDREIKLNGYRIDLEAIETTIRGLAGSHEVVVSVSGNGRALQACVIGPADAETLRDLSIRTAALLPDYMTPRFWSAFETPPLTASSKLDRTALAQTAVEAGITHIHSPDRRVTAAE